MRIIIWYIIRKTPLSLLALRFHNKSFLRKSGWFKSFSKKRSIDKNGLPLPWWNYSFIQFLKPRLKKDFKVLEFGGGSSTIFLSSIVRKIVTIENDESWSKKLKAETPENTEIIFCEQIDQFPQIAQHLNQDFEILIVDSLSDRIACAQAGLPYLSNNGVVIWDNTDGPDWPDIKRMMEQKNFKEVSFLGLAPQELSETRTTVFYRDHNILDL